MELVSARDIDNYSLAILKSSRSLDIFPTPVDRIVQYCELNIRTDIDLSVVHESYLHKAGDVLLKALEKVRGILDRRKKFIYLDQSMLPGRKNFVKLHEVGHEALPWQREIHAILEDDEESLSSHTNEEFEMEANYFASITLFQHDRFLREAAKFDLSIESAMQLAKQFGASVHSTLRRYVEKSPKNCALVVLEQHLDGGLLPICGKRDYFASQKFITSFGELDLPDIFDPGWEFAAGYLSKRKFLSGAFRMTTLNGEVTFRYQLFNNSYNGFVLLIPDGEKQSARTKVIFREAW